MAAGLADRRLPPDHELAAHPNLGPLRILMPVEEFPRHYATELLDHLYLPVDGLLQHIIDDLKVAGEVCTLQAPRQVDKDIEVGDEDDRPFTGASDFDEFLNVFYTHPGQIDADLRQAGLDIWQFHLKSSNLCIENKVTLQEP